MGVIGRALFLNPHISLYGFVFLSNHFHLLFSSSTGDQISSFVGYLKGNIARKLSKIRQRPGRLWKGRSAAIPIADSEALLARVKYLFSQGVKEGLVERPEHWPGASSLPWFLGEELKGHWVDWRLQRTALRRGRQADPSEYTIEYPINVAPLPCWSGSSRQAIASRTREILDKIADEAQLSRLYEVIGVESILQTDPLQGPAQRLKMRRPPICHASSQPIRAAFTASRREFVSGFRAASWAMKQGSGSSVVFPFGSFPPAGQFVRAPANYCPPWASMQQ